MKLSDLFPVFLLGAIVALVPGFVGGCVVGRNQARWEAILFDLGHYEFCKETGAVEFFWHHENGLRRSR